MACSATRKRSFPFSLFSMAARASSLDIFDSFLSSTVGSFFAFSHGNDTTGNRWNIFPGISGNHDFPQVPE